jgi:prepilin-type N-terminal cleavage/methylation domain-containing protein
MGRRKTHAARRGFTLIEVLISAALFSLLAGSIAMIALRGNSAVLSATLQNSVDNDCRRALDRVATELTSSGATVLNPTPSAPFGTESLTFRQGIGVNAGAIVWGPQIRIAFEYETGEVNDDVDNNGNGLIDEGQLVLTRDPGLASEQRIVLCHDLREYGLGETPNGLDDNGDGVCDERGFNAELIGTVLSLRLTIERVLPGQPAYARSLQTSVKLWN